MGAMRRRAGQAGRVGEEAGVIGAERKHSTRDRRQVSKASVDTK